MKITSIEAVPFRLQPRRDFKWAGLQIQLGGFVLVRIRTDDGLVGYGEATPLPDWGGDHGRRSGETQGTVVSIINDVLAPCLIGQDPLSITAACARMNRAAIGHTYAKCAIDIALHDIWGKALGVPVYQLLGGASRDGVQVAHMVGLMPDNDALDEAAGAVADGITAFQIKGGVDAERDIRLIRLLRQELGPRVTLRLDANQGYRHVKTAIAVIRALEESGLDFIEQPVMGMRPMAEVTQSVPVPVVADESCWNAADALEVVSTRAADCISIYLAKAGGIQAASRVAAVGEAAGLRSDVNGSIESAIGNAANLHLALAMPSITMAAVIPISAPAGTHPCRVGGNYYEDDVVIAPFAIRDGRLLPLDKPGLGIDIDEAKLARFIDA
jgi:muconate cycloisomerase